MGKVYTFKDGRLRLYDGSATPYYYIVKFQNADLAAPAGRARPAEKLIMDRGLLDANALYVQGADDAVTESLDISFSALLDDVENRVDLAQALVCGTVGGDAWTSTKGSTQLTNGAGESVTTPSFADGQKRCVNVEWLADGAADAGYRWAEVYFPPEEIRLSETMEGVVLSAVGRIYGAVAPITAFTAGSERT